MRPSDGLAHKIVFLPVLNYIPDLKRYSVTHFFSPGTFPVDGCVVVAKSGLSAGAVVADI